MPARRDQTLQELLGLIDRFGWAVRAVTPGQQPEEVAFAYTVGLTGLGHPEIVVTGLPAEHATTFLNDIGARVRDGARFEHGDLTSEFTSAEAPVLFIAVAKTENLTAVEEVYGLVRAVQMIWPDSAGHFPWVAGYRNRPEAQPLLGPLPAAKSDSLTVLRSPHEGCSEVGALIQREGRRGRHSVVVQSDHAVHGSPIWRERANYILDAPLVGDDLPKHFEQLWTRQVADNEFEICCIPFFLYDIALGDIVASRPDGSGLVDHVVRASGRYVFRAIIHDPEAPFDDVIAWITQRGGLIEWSSRTMIAIDAPNEVAAQQLADHLADLEAQGRLVYETGRS